MRRDGNCIIWMLVVLGVDGLGLLQGCRRARVLRSNLEPNLVQTFHLRILSHPPDGVCTFPVESS